MRITPAQRPKEKTPSKARVTVALRSFGGSLYKLCGCCVGLPMRQELDQSHPIRIRNGTNESAEFGGSGHVFTQLGPNDVSYKVREPKMVHQYILGDLLGEGSYAKVREAVDSITNRRVAIKILTKRKLKKLPAGESTVKKEVEIVGKLRHVNIVELIDYFTIEEKEKIYIVLEYIGGGTLQGLIERAPGGIMPRRQIQLIFRQLLAAVEYIHAHNVVHCDIKPDNLMFTEDGVLKMTDFGVAEEIGGRDSDFEILTKSGGSPAFQPPEVKSGNSLFSPVKIDIWSIGITLYIMAIGKYPFSGTNIYTICENISKGEYLLPDTLEPELAQLIKGILQINPGDRLSIQDMKANTWVATDITSDEPLIPYVTHATDTPQQHNIFAQNYRVAAGQGLYASTDDFEETEDEEPTVFTLDESENSTYSSGTTQLSGNHHKLRHGSNTSTASPSSSMTNLPSTSLTTSSTHSPKTTRPRSKLHCIVM